PVSAFICFLCTNFPFSISGFTCFICTIYKYKLTPTLTRINQREIILSMPSESSRTSSSDLPESFNLPDTSEPPLYRIDLDLQPRFRHRQICEEFAGEIRSLISLFDDV